MEYDHAFSPQTEQSLSDPTILRWRECLPSRDAHRYQHMTPAEWADWFWSVGQVSAYATLEHFRRRAPRLDVRSQPYRTK
jgi:hypothetical protein